ncbi:MAG: amino acid adenylation domain-containing protein, partial [Myxococcales bacterium]|nr:amino acid adenylation domain-containing protein [Myxococcales bacterium]
MAADAKDRARAPSRGDFDPFAGGELESAYPTTEGQRAIWASVALGMSDAVRAYNESVRIRLRGPLKLDAFRSAFNELVGRHEALRASFSPDGMTMCVSSEALLRLEVEDLSGRSESEWASRLDAIRREQALHVFDLVRGPAARAWLVRVTAEEHWFFFTGHHLICDGWSIAVVLYELGRLYSHRVTGVGEPLPPADRFGVYAERERTAFSGDERAKLERFWLEHFRDGIPSFEIPLDHPRPSERAYRAQRIDTELDSTLITQVRQVGQKHKASLVVTLAASFCAYVSRISGQSDVVLAVPAAGQALEGEEHLIGHCVNVMPIRMSVDPNESFTDFLARFRIAFMDAYEHQQVPFGALLRLLRVPRDPSRIPLVPVTFNVDTGMDNFDFAGMEATYFSSPKEFGDFEVTINAAQLRDRFVSECTFNTDLYTAESMERHMREWETLVRGIVQAPGTSVGELPLLDDAARRTIVEDWNDTAVDFPVTTLSALVEAQATVAPDRRALVFEGAQFTYGELDARANRLANHLIAAGVRPGAMVALVMERSAEMVIAALGIMKAGGAYVPVEPSYPAERVAFMFEDTSAEFVVTEAHSRDRIPRTTAKVVDVDADRAAIAGASAGAPARAPSPEDVAYVIYTSGSTGRPKGVLTPHRAAANYVQSMAVEPGVGPGDVVTAAASLGFDMSVFDIWVPLTSGATCVVLSREVTLDGRTLAAAMDAAAATISMLTPVSWRMMLDGGWAGSPKLRAMSGGEELSPELRTRLLPKVRELYNVYGPTETTVLSHFERVTNAAGPVAIGKPLKNVVAYILDGRGKPVPIGASGELCIGGAGVALGYHRRPELTREKFVPDPFRPGSTMYRSGDLAKFLPDGSVQWLGRIDHQVKIRGYRIELGEIEQAIVADPSIEQVVVEPRTLDGDKQLVAYVVVRSGAKLDEPELRAKLRGSLPPYMLPAQFVVLPALPVSASGKIDRKSLPDPVGEKRVVRAAAPQDQPQTPIEEVLMDVWEDVLGQRPRRTDNFFDLGGHS